MLDILPGRGENIFRPSENLESIFLDISERDISGMNFHFGDDDNSQIFSQFAFSVQFTTSRQHSGFALFGAIAIFSDIVKLTA